MDRFGFVNGGVAALAGRECESWALLVKYMYSSIPVCLLVDHNGSKSLVMVGSFDVKDEELCIKLEHDPELSKFRVPSSLERCRIQYTDRGFLDILFKTHPPMSSIGRLVMPTTSPSMFIDFFKHYRDMLSVNIPVSIVASSPSPRTYLFNKVQEICTHEAFPSHHFPAPVQPQPALLSRTLPESLIPKPVFNCGFDPTGEHHLMYKLRPVFADVSLTSLTKCDMCRRQSFKADGLFPRIYISLAKLDEVLRTWDSRTKASYGAVLGALHSGCIFPHHQLTAAQIPAAQLTAAQIPAAQLTAAQIPGPECFDDVSKIMRTYSNALGACVEYYNLKTSLCIVTERDQPALDAMKRLARLHKALFEFRKESFRLRTESPDVSRILGWGKALNPKLNATKCLDLSLSLKRDRDWDACPVCEAPGEMIEGTKRFCRLCELEFCCKCDRVIQFDSNPCACTPDTTRLKCLLRRAEKEGVPFIDISES
jgi:hypothetical protein